MKNNLKFTKHVLITLFVSISCTSFGMESVGDWFAEQEELAQYEVEIERILKNEPSQRDDELSEMLFNEVSNGDVDNTRYIHLHSITALMYAAMRGKTEVAELLLKYHANVNARDDNGDTALMWAAGRGYPDIVKLLLEYGANPCVTNEEGLTAVGTARISQLNESNPAIKEDIIDLLQEAMDRCPPQTNQELAYSLPLLHEVLFVEHRQEIVPPTS